MSVWTSDEINEFKKMVEAGASPTRLAAKFNRTRGAIKSLARQEGLRLKSSKEVRKANGLSPFWSMNQR